MADIDIKWEAIREGNDPNWDTTHVLYAYYDRAEEQFINIGSAYAEESSVEERYNAADKQEMLDEAQEDGHSHIILLVGDIHMRGNISQQQVIDLESLLIRAEQPKYNTQYKDNRPNGREGQTVDCRGEWPGSSHYTDPGPGKAKILTR